MLLGVASALLMFGAGLALLRLLRVGRGMVAIGLAPAAGVALLAGLATWLQQLRVPEPLIGVAVLVVGLTGLVSAAIDSRSRVARWRADRVAVSVLAATVAIPLGVLSSTLSIQSGVPDYTFDGPFHAETIEAMRHGVVIAGAGWYPTGFHGPVAALLALVPGVDSASGVVGWAAGLTLLAPLALFGLGLALWRDPRVAATGALLLALTAAFPYEPQLYSEWPMAAGLLLVIGLWTVAAEYVSGSARPLGAGTSSLREWEIDTGRARPIASGAARVAVLGGVVAGALLLTHGSEIYTAAIGLVVLALAQWRALAARRTIAHLALALCAALLFTAPYLAAVAHWSASGGATAVGADYFDIHRATQLHQPLLETLFWSSAISSGLLVDLPLRLALLGIGVWLAVHDRRGRALLVLTAIFLGLVAIFRFVDVPLVRQVFALTLPWGVDGRLLQVLPIVTAPLGGAGLAWVTRRLVRQARDGFAMAGRGGLASPRAARRTLAFGAAIGVATLGLNAARFRLETDHIVTYSADDAAAFSWLRQHAQPGDVLMNDGAADAGIWAPYKADINIALPHTRSVSPDAPEVLVRSELDQLTTRPDVLAAACALHITYVYHGEANSTSEYREFPSLTDLRNNSALDEVFSSGDAAVFRTRLPCP